MNVKFDSLLEALDEYNRVIFCNKYRKCMFIVDFDSYEFVNSMWWSKIFLYKNNVKCGEIICGSYDEWFIDDNNQICIIP